MIAAIVILFIIITIIIIAVSIANKGDETIQVKSRKAVDNFDLIKYFRENSYQIESFLNHINRKKQNNKGDTLDVVISYISPTGKSRYSRKIVITEYELLEIKKNPKLLMTNSEINKYNKTQQQNDLNSKKLYIYNKINSIIDFTNNLKDNLIIKSDETKLDQLISTLYDRTVSPIKKIKTINDPEWTIIESTINNIKNDIDKINKKNQDIKDYYISDNFKQIKDSCENLMNSQREFNEYIDEKAESISKLFGKRIVRTETSIEDTNNYIRPYKKSIDAFTAEVSANVFASAENNPIEYVVKYFYPNKIDYPEQIQKLQTLVEELETLSEAKDIIENYKKDYQQYLINVPSYIMEYDKDGFYSRLGFANLNENRLTIAYKFSYTSNGGMTQRSFTVPMTEETIIKLIEILQNKLTYSSFAKEQRRLMTSKLRREIKERDNYTCKLCGNSTYNEPNLLLEIDHIIPIAKGGITEESNLQTLCWKCNRHKSDNL